MQSQFNNVDRPLIADRVLIWPQFIDNDTLTELLAGEGLDAWYEEYPFIGSYYILHANGNVEPHDVYCGDCCDFVWS